MGVSIVFEWDMNGILMEKLEDFFEKQGEFSGFLWLPWFFTVSFWLVVWNMVYFSISLECYSQLTSIFLRRGRSTTSLSLFLSWNLSMCLMHFTRETVYFGAVIAIFMAVQS